MPRIILLGPPGSGKGTHAEKIQEEYDIPAISTGNALREELAAGTPTGLKAKAFMDEGKLVPDEIILELVDGMIDKYDVTNGFMFDGFPRTVVQAEALDALLAKKDMPLDTVLLMSAPTDVIVSRIADRRVCPVCGNSYNLSWRQPDKEGICDACEGELIQREDDKAETVLKRIEVYNEQTSPLVAYYKKQGILFEIDVTKEMDIRQKQINDAIRRPHDQVKNE